MNAGTYKELLRNGGFHSFLWTQFLEAFNDNVYKVVVSLLAIEMAVERGGQYLSLAGMVFCLPFLLFSGYAGHLADAFSKRTILIAVKGFEVVAMLAAVAAFLSHRIEWMLAVLFLMGAHAAFFNPAKYGILPEMLPDKDLSLGQRPARNDHLRWDHPGNHRRQPAAGHVEDRNLEDRNRPCGHRRGRCRHQPGDHARSSFRRNAGVQAEPLVAH